MHFSSKVNVTITHVHVRLLMDIQVNSKDDGQTETSS